MKLHVRATRHGPVMSDVSKEFAKVAGPNQAVALAFTGLSGEDTTFEGDPRSSIRRAIGTEFRDALKLAQAPMQNIGYADVNGDIGLIAPGRVPLRKSGDGLAPTDGATRRDRLDGLRAVRGDAANPQSRKPASCSTPTIRSSANGPGGDVRPRLGRAVPRPPAAAVLRSYRQTFAGDFGADAGRPSVARRASSSCR